MRRATASLILLGVLVTGCHTFTGFSVRETSNTIEHDDFVGWYEYSYQSNDALIPIFKSDGIYYSVRFGWKVPLEESVEGLRIDDITIVFDKATSSPFMRIDYYNQGDPPPPSKRCSLTKVTKPSWFHGPEAQPPA